MKVQAEVSLYPLRKPSIKAPIHSFVRSLRHNGCRVAVGPMSSHLDGECKTVFQTVAEAFEEAARDGDVVLIVKVGNACRGEPGSNKDLEDRRSS